MTGHILRHRLRIETNEVHELLHRHPYFSAIADGTIESQKFDQLMALMGGFYATLDPLMTQACRHLGSDAGQYRYRARVPYFSIRSRDAPALPEIRGLAALAGAAYVVDGAVLGGQVLRKAIAGRLVHPYWDWCAEDGRSVWSGTQALIDLADAEQASSDKAIEVAIAVFQAFSGHMEMSTEEAPV